MSREDLFNLVGEEKSKVIFQYLEDNANLEAVNTLYNHLSSDGRMIIDHDGMLKSLLDIYYKEKDS
jgi:hypothetical protein